MFPNIAKNTNNKKKFKYKRGSNIFHKQPSNNEPTKPGYAYIYIDMHMDSDIIQSTCVISVY